ncbi:hypothetical protein DY000_02024848 [Brassica cretica]|uniref:Uncharacterized protein n=1 Tax=Brassica cretica TaxID=69181 RepID=A0ABQ7E6P5_BRACR|nr:hypothetical protein DY000_02024848 [Brassica cretica]
MNRNDIGVCGSYDREVIGRRVGDNVRKGSVYGSDQFLLDNGYWIGCVLDRVGLTGRQAVEELNSGFGASVGGSERTLERGCVIDVMAYAIVKEGCRTDENVLSGSGRTTSSTGSAREREETERNTERESDADRKRQRWRRRDQSDPDPAVRVLNDGNGRRSGDNVRKGSVYGSDQFLLDIGHWIGCVLDRVGLTGRQAVAELNGEFGASVGGSERTLERGCVLNAMSYAIGTGSRALSMASVLSVLDGWLETKPSLFVYLDHVGMVG